MAASSAQADPAVTIDSNPTGLYNSAQVSGTIDPGPNDTYFTFQTSTDQVNWSGFNYEGFAAGGSGQQAIPTREIGGLTPGTTYYVRLAALDNVTTFEGSEAFSAGPNPSFTTKPVGEPAVTFLQPSAVTGTSAHFSGSIDPEAPQPENNHAFDVTWYLECTPECPDMPYEFIEADTDPHPISVDAKDLLPGTDYEVRLIVQNAGGTHMFSKSFTTSVLPPTVNTSAAHTSPTGATLFGSINPNGAEVSYHFEYGPNFENSTPTKSIFAGTSDTPVVATITGLEPETTYPFRLVAVNSAGEVVSAEKSFTTGSEAVEQCPNAQFRVGPSASLPDCRAYELVNPPGTDWSDIVRVFPSADDGSHVAYMTLVPPEISSSAVVAASFVSSRTDSGWTTRDANLRVKYVYGLAVSIPACFSSDWSKAIIDSPASMTDDDTDPGYNDLFRVDVGNPIGEWLSYGETLPDPYGGVFNFLGASPDLSSVAFFGQFDPSLSSEAPSGRAIYVRDSNGLKVVSRELDGSVIDEPSPAGSNCGDGRIRGNGGVSADGTKIFYYPTAVYSGPIYRYDTETEDVVAISRSHRTGETNVIGGGSFSYASPDGDIVYFFSGDKLTNDATEGGGIYRYQVSTDTLEQITPALGDRYLFGLEGAVYPAENDSRVFFSSQRRLTPGAPRNPSKLYVWDPTDTGGTPGPGGPGKGTTRLIASITDGGIARVSPNGRYMLFQSRNSVDGAPNKGKNTIYLYDAETEDIACVSCRPNGTPSARDSNLADEPESLTFGIINPRNITNDGRVFFNSSDRLSPADQTFAQDVYEYDQGKVSLISAGQGDELQSYLTDNSDDGSHVFFLSRWPLRPEDNDSEELDIYDAHSGGGFPLPKPVPPICEGEACRTATSPKPEDLAPTTPNFSGPPNPRAHRVKRKRHHRPKKHHHRRRHGAKHHNGQKRHRGGGR